MITDTDPKLYWVEDRNDKKVLLIKKNGKRLVLEIGDMISFKFGQKIIAKIIGFTFQGPYSQPNGMLFTEYKNGVWDEWTIRKKKLNIFFHFDVWKTVKKIYIEPPLPPSNFESEL